MPEPCTLPSRRPYHCPSSAPATAPAAPLPLPQQRPYRRGAHSLVHLHGQGGRGTRAGAVHALRLTGGRIGRSALSGSAARRAGVFSPRPRLLPRHIRDSRNIGQRTNLADFVQLHKEPDELDGAKTVCLRPVVL